MFSCFFDVVLQCNCIIVLYTKFSQFFWIKVSKIWSFFQGDQIMFDFVQNSETHFLMPDLIPCDQCSSNFKFYLVIYRTSSLLFLVRKVNTKYSSIILCWFKKNVTRSKQQGISISFAIGVARALVKTWGGLRSRKFIIMSIWWIWL